MSEKTKEDIKKMSDEEYKKYIEEKEKNYGLTVGQLIEHLQKNFKPTDKICFWYEGGAYMNCERIPEDYLGYQMFVKVKDDKVRRMKDYDETKEQVDDDYKWVDDEDVLMY